MPDVTCHAIYLWMCNGLDGRGQFENKTYLKIHARVVDGESDGAWCDVPRHMPVNVQCLLG